MTCDPDSLIKQAQCIEMCIPPGMQPAVLIYLLCQIMQNGGGGGGSAGCCNLTGHYGGAKPAPPAIAVPAGNMIFAVDLDPGHATWRWNPDINDWY